MLCTTATNTSNTSLGQSSRGKCPYFAGSWISVKHRVTESDESKEAYMPKTSSIRSSISTEQWTPTCDRQTHTQTDTDGHSFISSSTRASSVTPVKMLNDCQLTVTDGSNEGAVDKCFGNRMFQVLLSVVLKRFSRRQKRNCTCN